MALSFTNGFTSERFSCRLKPEDLHCRSMDISEKRDVIPILLDNAKLPDDGAEWPEELRFLHYYNYVCFPTDPDIISYSPMAIMKNKHPLRSRPEKGEIYRNLYNSNSSYDVNENFQSLLKKADTDDADTLYELALNYYYGFTDTRKEIQKENFLIQSQMHWPCMRPSASPFLVRCRIPES